MRNMDKGLKKTLLAILVVLALSLLPGAARATIIDFGVIFPTAGTISFAGGLAPLVGTNISVDNVSLDTGVTYNILSGLLNFVTGGLTGSTASTWQFAGGLFSTLITITGTVDVNNNGIVDSGDITGTLLTGAFSNGASVTAFGNQFMIAGATFFDTKNSDMLKLLGLTNTSYAGNFNISFNSPGTSPNAFTSTTVLSGDVTNSPVPEPATMILLGSGLFGIGVFARRKLRRKA